MGSTKGAPAAKEPFDDIKWRTDVKKLVTFYTDKFPEREGLPIEADWSDDSAEGPRNQVLKLLDLVDTIAPTDDNAMVLAAPGVGMQELAASPKSLNRLSASLQQMLRGISSALDGDSNGFFCAVELAKCAVATAGILYLCSAAPENTYTDVDFKGNKEKTRSELQVAKRTLVQRS